MDFMTDHPGTWTSVPNPLYLALKLCFLYEPNFIINPITRNQTQVGNLNASLCDAISVLEESLDAPSILMLEVRGFGDLRLQVGYEIQGSANELQLLSDEPPTPFSLPCCTPQNHEPNRQYPLILVLPYPFPRPP